MEEPHFENVQLGAHSQNANSPRILGSLLNRLYNEIAAKAAILEQD
jgi:hypothetical protein